MGLLSKNICSCPPGVCANSQLAHHQMAESRDNLSAKAELKCQPGAAIYISCVCVEDFGWLQTLHTGSAEPVGTQVMVVDW